MSRTIQLRIKRLFDIVASGIGLILLLPLFALIAIAIRLDTPGEIFFPQARLGFKGSTFRLWKFRTMRPNLGGQGKPLSDAERITRVGHLLRKTSLDELPQLWNVLNGEQSLVGPRPLLATYGPLYSPEQMRRHDVVPGITGWAQVNGRNRLDWEKKFELDLWYVDHFSLLLDARILMLTVQKVLKGEWVSPPGAVTAEEFKGSTR